MARRPRLDDPGSWHHVVNRGIAKRRLFETRSDIRYFLARLARQVRCGRIEVHAYCIMSTHFHLLVRSPGGQLSEAMRRLQNEHSRRFNRSRKRDGALIRGRFFSRRVDSDAYRRSVVRYIDANPVRAGVARSSCEYEFGSAAAFERGRGRPWLSRSWVQDAACTFTHSAHYDQATYRLAFSSDDTPELSNLCELVERRLSSRLPTGANEDLLGGAPHDIRRWMEWKRRIADGERPGLPVCVPAALQPVIDAEFAARDPAATGMNADEGKEIAQIGLLHDLCGRTWPEIGRMLHCTTAKARKLHQAHRRMLRDQSDYSERIRRIRCAAPSI